MEQPREALCERVDLQQADACARYFIPGTELQSYNEHFLELIGDDLLARSQERQLVLIVLRLVILLRVLQAHARELAHDLKRTESGLLPRKLSLKPLEYTEKNIKRAEIKRVEIKGSEMKKV